MNGIVESMREAAHEGSIDRERGRTFVKVKT